ncbi:MAG TPA: AI-2E family transporter [Novosphingobium sp.]|nr:AI-2E family transporter [Novosphingobium sp.]HQA18541.1 AI-2E family transporter [Novosphingobium sp.]
MARKPAPSAEPAPPPPPARHTGPTDISDPLLRTEAKRAAVWIGMAALLALTVYLAEPLLVIFGGMVFAAMIDGGARLLGRVLPIGRGWRVTLVLLLTLAFFAWVVMFAGSQIAEQAAQLPGTIESQTLKVLAWLKLQGVHFDIESMQGLIEKALGGVGQITSALGGVIGGFTTAFLIAVMAIYFAAEPQLYRRGFAWLLPAEQREHFEGTATIMGRTLRRLLAGRLLGMAVEGISTWLLLAAYGVPMAALLGLLTGLLAFLPNIGAPMSGALMIMVGFSGGVDMGIYCIIVYVVVQTVDGNIIVPMVAKKTADLAPALVLGAQLIMGALFGLLGLLLADPLVAMIKVALERQSHKNESA